MRSCEECTKCCELLYGSAYGHEFGNGIKCKFLGNCGCKIYKVRPNVCRNYFCAWAQELLPEEMRPDKCGVLVSVEEKDNKKFLKVIGESSINNDIITYLKEWSIKMNTPVIYKENNCWRVL
jgi:Fe-S-cluster containining protein